MYMIDGHGLIGCHDNAATVWLSAKVLQGLTEEHGNKVQVIEI